MSEVGREPRIIGVDSDDADDLIGALSSETARDILAHLHDEEATPSEIAEAVDTTVQNARYHLDSLSDAELVEVNGTRYSEKGREMDVYEAAQPLVVYVGREEDSFDLRDAFDRFVGALALLAAGSFFVQWLFGVYSPDGTRDGFLAEDDAVEEEEDDMDAFDVEEPDDSPDAAPEADDAEDMAAETPGLVDSAADFIFELPPGVVFFAAGFVVLAVGFAVWYRRRM